MSFGNDRRIRVWDASTGAEQRSVPVPLRHAQGASVSLAPDQPELVVATTTGALSRLAIDGTPNSEDEGPPALITRLLLDAGEIGLLTRTTSSRQGAATA